MKIHNRSRDVLLPVLFIVGVVSGSMFPAAPTTADERFLPFLIGADFRKMDNVGWRIELPKPDPSNPLLEPEMPWDIGGIMAEGTVLLDPIDGLWKAWHSAISASYPKANHIWPENKRIAYLESQDGVHWERPKLSVVGWEGYEHTNLIVDIPSSYPSVGIFPERQWPYEMVAFSSNDEKRGLYKYHSKDGKDWKTIAGPFRLQTNDSCYVYEFSGGKHVSYHKYEIPAFPGALVPYDVAAGNVRLIGMRTSEDGIHNWSDPTRFVMTPDWRDPADTQFMELCPMEHPGGYIATLTVYHNLTQKIDVQWAASRDGINWWRPERAPMLRNGSLGDYGGGMIWPFRTPVMEGNKLHIYFSGSQGLHADLFGSQKGAPLMARGERLNQNPGGLSTYGALCRATIDDASRLWALTTASGGPYEGSATTRPLRLSRKSELAGKRLLVNVVTRRNGQLVAELLDSKNNPVDGFSKNDCEPVKGDHHRKQVRWIGGDVAPETAEKIKFYLKATLLYGFDAVE